MPTQTRPGGHMSNTTQAADLERQTESRHGHAPHNARILLFVYALLCFMFTSEQLSSLHALSSRSVVITLAPLIVLLLLILFYGGRPLQEVVKRAMHVLMILFALSPNFLVFVDCKAASQRDYTVLLRSTDDVRVLNEFGNDWRFVFVAPWYRTIESFQNGIRSTTVCVVKKNFQANYEEVWDVLVTVNVPLAGYERFRAVSASQCIGYQCDHEFRRQFTNEVCMVLEAQYTTITGATGVSRSVTMLIPDLNERVNNATRDVISKWYLTTENDTQAVRVTGTTVRYLEN